MTAWRTVSWVGAPEPRLHDRSGCSAPPHVLARPWSAGRGGRSWLPSKNMFDVAVGAMLIGKPCRRGVPRREGRGLRSGSGEPAELMAWRIPVDPGGVLTRAQRSIVRAVGHESGTRFFG